jgi:hypothetical protein
MRLIETLRRRAAEESSPFRAQLFREDVARLDRLLQLARNEPELAAFKTAGLRIGWTPGDARTQELRAPLERLLDLIHEHQTSSAGAELSWTLRSSRPGSTCIGCAWNACWAASPSPHPSPSTRRLPLTTAVSG